MSRLPALVCWTIAASAFAFPAQAATWRSDHDQSQLAFLATYEGAQAPGEFLNFEVELECGEDDPAGGRLTVTVEIGSVDMRSADLNEVIVEPEWFDSARFPQARFETRRIQPDARGGFQADGALTLKGIEQPVTVPFEWNTSGDRAQMQGSLVLNRVDFKIGLGEWAASDVIGHSVEVRFQVELVRVP